MCGIIGIASITKVINRTWLADGREAIRHRGPDSSGEWWSNDGAVGLGHVRLAVIDLSSFANQPMHDNGEELTIVFNGEIYNFNELRKTLIAKGYAFKSHSDTEVILASYREWGTDCLSHFNGMFAFALYDKRKQEIFLARDCAGEKPLYFALNNGELRFASELKGLMADRFFSRNISHDALDCYLNMGYVPGDLCILKGVKKLQAGYAMVFNHQSGKSKSWRYWDIQDLEESSGTTLPDELLLADELEDLLESSVRRQLVADVPVGILLSGGIDSSLVTAMASRITSNLKTFTVRFPRYPQHDESEYARLIASHFNTEHIELDISEITPDILPLLARQFDEPIADSSMIPSYLIAQLVRKHCTVALGGDGGDELFGGYGYDRLLRMQKILNIIPKSARVLLSKSSEIFLPVGFKGRNYLQGFSADLQTSLPLMTSFFDRTLRKKLLSGWSSLALNAEYIREQRVPNHTDLLQRVTRMDFKNFLADDILVKTDRSSMINSLELRSPFLDQHIIDFSFKRVPSHMKTTVSGRKLLLQQLTTRLLPENFDQKRKQGFSIPLAIWLQSAGWRDYFHDVLLGSDNSIFDSKEVKKLLDGQDKGRSNSERLFSLVMFELWREEYQVSM
jgi:asparagine synthase (glutamine-hydrolysing)